MGYRHKHHTSRRCEYHGQFTCHSLPRNPCTPQPLFNSKPFIYNYLRTGMTNSVGLLSRPAYHQEKSPTLLLQTFPDVGDLSALGRSCVHRPGRPLVRGIFQDIEGVSWRAGKPSFLPLEFGFSDAEMGPRSRVKPLNSRPCGLHQAGFVRKNLQIRFQLPSPK